MNLRLSAFALSAALLACGSTAAPVARALTAATAVRTIAAVGTNARFTLATTPLPPGATCPAPGGLYVFPNPLTVTYGGTQVVRIAPCSATAGDRMGAYISQPYGCGSTADSTLGTLGDGGSAANGTNVAVIAGYTPCTGDVLTVNDATTGATADVPIAIVY